ncbi:MAG: hypothetical protein GOVbin2066_16 [Prokaryotic dsDNA virus sp.]|nr:MAG: hypothetical protein GOVbin2066_16 [Prokaryotic dsDNA virus sp.]|tara:strand:+ start:1324 stop:1587 length:264 start_codon:yes stop_codon:yes gene_type:complete
MFIQVGDTWAIASDEHCWMIKKYEQPNTTYPEGRWKAQTFHSKIEDAINSMTAKRIRLSEATTLADAIKDAQDIKKEIKAVFDDKLI